MTINGINLVRIREVSSSGTGDSESYFEISRYTNVHVKLFPMSRKSSYRELRYAPKSDYASAEEFLVGSINTEAFPEEVSIHVSWEHLEAIGCSDSELKGLYAELQKTIAKLPAISEVEFSTFLNTGFDFSWSFIEGSENYYSVFWRDTEKKLLKLCA